MALWGLLPTKLKNTLLQKCKRNICIWHSISQKEHRKWVIKCTVNNNWSVKYGQIRCLISLSQVSTALVLLTGLLQFSCQLSFKRCYIFMGDRTNVFFFDPNLCLTVISMYLIVNTSVRVMHLELWSNKKSEA